MNLFVGQAINKHLLINTSPHLNRTPNTYTKPQIINKIIYKFDFFMPSHTLSFNQTLNSLPSFDFFIPYSPLRPTYVNINLTFLYALPNPVMTTQHTLSLNRHTLESKHVIQYESCYIDATYKKDCNKGLS